MPFIYLCITCIYHVIFSTYTHSMNIAICNWVLVWLSYVLCSYLFICCFRFNVVIICVFTLCIWFNDYSLNWLVYSRFHPVRPDEGIQSNLFGLANSECEHSETCVEMWCWCIDARRNVQFCNHRTKNVCLHKHVTASECRIKSERNKAHIGYYYTRTMEN